MLGLSAAGKMLNKTAHNMFTSSSASTSGNTTSATPSAAADPTASNTSANSTYTAASAAAASAAALNSMKSLTLDISSSARSAVGNLKWSTGQK